MIKSADVAAGVISAILSTANTALWVLGWNIKTLHNMNTHPPCPMALLNDNEGKFKPKFKMFYTHRWQSTSDDRVIDDNFR